MSLPNVLAVAALASSIVLLVQSKTRLFSVLAVAASGLEVLMGLGVLKLSLFGLPINLILGAVLTVAGVAIYMKVASKTAVSCATVIALVGAIQVLGALHVV